MVIAVLKTKSLEHKVLQAKNWKAKLVSEAILEQSVRLIFDLRSGTEILHCTIVQISNKVYRFIFASRVV